MNAKELRIGNLLESNGRICVVTNIDSTIDFKLSSEGVFFCEFLEEPKYYLGRSDIENYEPILLTDEWLIKFGFTNDEDYFNIGNIHYNLKTKKIYIGNDHVSSGHDDTELSYIHQLQNIYFAIKRKELIFKY
ncbi:hypothetical protein CMU14_13200 [Elizabethkingia anophelis]|nr:hypothetical protein [Elizabethkingia anophelis]